jgi:hypothetical protein
MKVVGADDEEGGAEEEEVFLFPKNHYRMLV